MNRYPHLLRRISPNIISQYDRWGSVTNNSHRWGSVTNNSQTLCVFLPVTRSHENRQFSTLTPKRSLGVVKISDCFSAAPPLHTFREYAARKGTRTRRDAKKVKKVEVKQPFIFKNLKKLAALPYKTMRPIDQSSRSLPEDDMYCTVNFRPLDHEFDEAVKMLRQTHHPTVYNVPNAPLILRVNMDFKIPSRAIKCMDGWKSIVEMKQPFLLEGMTRPSVLAFCMEDVDYVENVMKEGGADLAGGKEIIKAIQAGDINPEEYEYLVAHPSVVPELAVIRGLIKRRFPSVKNRTISTDLVPEIKRLKSGIKVQAITTDREPDFGYIETPIGTLDMDGLVENFKSIILDTLPRRAKGKSPEDFIISCVLRTDTGFEEFNVETASILQEFESQRKNAASSPTTDDN